MNLLWLPCICALYICLGISSCEDFVVPTLSGQLRGQVVNYDGNNNITVFKGVPYAEPPIGNLRFRKPAPIQSWGDIKNVTEDTPVCMQNGTMPMSEDCLFLNVYVPGILEEGSGLGIVVFFHGLTADFLQSWGTNMDGSALAIRGQVIVITLNYRVGLFGFLSTRGSDYPGNYGLWDQLMALSWISDNIAAFGGDPGRITLWGNSAGGASVFLHMMSNYGEGKFQRVIIQSGFGLNPSILATDPIMTLSRVSKAMGCSLPEDDSESIAACIKSKDAEEIVRATSSITRNRLSIDGTPAFIQWIGPVVDGDFLVDTPDNLLSDITTDAYSLFTTRDMLVGLTDGEGAATAMMLKEFEESYNFSISENIPTSVLCDVVAVGIANQFYGGSTNVSEAICQKYRLQGSGDLQTRKIAELYRDFLYASPIMKTIRIRQDTDSSHRYLYLFVHEPEHGSVLDRPPWLSGAGHGDDVMYLFDLQKQFEGKQISGSELELSKQMKNFWTLFANRNSPNWPEYEMGNGLYQYIDFYQHPENHLYSSSVDFWLTEIPELVNADPRVTSTSTVPTGTDVKIETTTEAPITTPPVPHDPIVATRSGKLRGQIVSYDENNNITVFKGIPYAEPPIGNMRFQKPASIQRWGDIKDATKEKPVCMQDGSISMSEDCLFLNVYVPVEIEDAKGMTVMVFFHGLTGDFSRSWGTNMDGSALAIRGQVIVVTLNYRVGLFGFLSTRGSDYPGNYGLWDQLMALSWTYDNIAAFGGDPGKITLWGNSAGGASVFLHMMSNYGKGKFQRVIIQSGFGLNPSILATDPIMTLSRVGKAMGCSLPEDDPESIAACIKTKDAEEIVRATSSITRNRLSIDGTPAFIQWIGPVVDGDFLVDTPDNLLSDTTTDAYSLFTTRDMLVGLTDGDGAATAMMLEEFEESYNFSISENIPTSVLCDVVAVGISNQFYGGSTDVSEAICQKYRSQGSGDLQAHKIAELYRDFLYASPIMKTIRIRQDTDSSHRYLYLFVHEPEHGSVLDRPPWLSGAGHGDDVMYLFDLEKQFEGKQISGRELELSKNMKNFWTLFANRDSPNWPEYEMGNGLYQYIDFYQHPDNHLYSSSVDFWLAEIPELVNAGPRVTSTSTLPTGTDVQIETTTEAPITTPPVPQDPVVATRSGKLRGQIVSYDENNNITVFKGIPYAEPPIGNMRFQKPASIQRWSDIKDATEEKPVCMQDGSITMSEDCLFLNVYVPVEIGDAKGMTVMVFFHGLTGDFSRSWGTNMDGSALAIRGQVIVVTLNYRVGLFGFLSTRGSDYPGNYGLWDQLMALSWISDNIAAFGGDPGKITLWGNSAGGASVFLHMMSNYGKGKFQRVIIQSGFGLNPSILATDPIMTLSRVGKAMGCNLPEDDPESIAACIKTKDAEEIVRATSSITRNRLSIDGTPAFIQWIGPVVDGDFLVDTPDNLLSDTTSDAYSLFTTRDMLVGLTDGEGATTAMMFEEFEKSYNFSISEDIPASVLCDVVAVGISNQFYGGSTSVSEAICQRYKAENPMNHQGELVVELYRDFLYMSPIIKTIRIRPATDFTHRYLYLFVHEPEHGSVLGRPPWLSGAGHSDDVMYLFDLEKQFEGKKISGLEMEIAKRMKDMWVAFARNGIPRQFEWPEFNDIENYLQVDISNHPKKNLYSSAVNFWLNHIPQLITEVNPQTTVQLTSPQTTIRLTSPQTTVQLTSPQSISTEITKATTSQQTQKSPRNSSRRVFADRFIICLVHSLSVLLYITV
ncbi:hypothetical protein ScPMuIL_009233 [Solemya velum]